MEVIIKTQCYLVSRSPNQKTHSAAYLDAGHLRLELENFFQLLVVLHYNDVGPAVVDNVLARIRTVGRVDADREAASHDGTHLSNEPFWCIEAKDSHRTEAFQAQLDKGLGYSPGFLIVLKTEKNELKIWCV